MLIAVIIYPSTISLTLYSYIYFLLLTVVIFVMLSQTLAVMAAGLILEVASVEP